MNLRVCSKFYFKVLRRVVDNYKVYDGSSLKDLYIDLYLYKTKGLVQYLELLLKSSYIVHKSKR